jgi:CheY-like chemotaxis protein
MTSAVPARSRTVLWVDDEAEQLEAHRLFLHEKGYEVEWARNADDAVEMLRRHAFDIVLLDEQMPGKRGLEAYREFRELRPTLPVVLVTKSEEDTTLREAIGVDIREYLVKPVNPRQVHSVIARILEGPRLRKEALARDFVSWFRQVQTEPPPGDDWRAWLERWVEISRWDVELASAGETGLYDSLRSLYPDLHRDFAQFIGRMYPAWLKDLSGDRPALSIDVVSEFVLPVLDRQRSVALIVVDCLRLDQWAVLEPLLTSRFEVETTHYFSILPTATPYARNALFSGLFPGEIAARFPDLWKDRDDESLNAHEHELLTAHVRDLRGYVPVRYTKVANTQDSLELERRISGTLANDGVNAFVFNFVDLLTHGRSESAILFEVARDEVALRALTRQWFERSSLFALLEEAARRKVSVVLTSDHGALHCNTPATVFARRDATLNLRYKFGEDIRAENPDQVQLYTDPDVLRLPHRGHGVNTILAVGDTFFVYPTKLREYQSRYRGSFLHGGISPEEMVVPLALLTPRG